MKHQRQKTYFPFLLGSAFFFSSAVPVQAGWWSFGKKKTASDEAAPQASPKLPIPPIQDEVAEEKAGRSGEKASQSEDPDAKGPSDQPAKVKTGEGGLPSEVVIKAEDSSKLSATKPHLHVEVDSFESIRSSLKPDESLLLAVSPLTVSWRRTHPEFLHSSRVAQPWRMTFSPRPGIVFRPRDQLSDVLQRRIDPKEAKSYAWSLTIADEEGRVFHHYEGSSDPPEELLWSGQNDQGEWIHAGRSYSAVYTFTDSGGSPRTSVAKPLLFRGIVHQEDSGLHISMDSSVLFGSSKTNSALADPAGKELMRSAADLIKRRFTGIPISVRVFASSKELGESQGLAVMDYMVRELMIASSNIGVAAARAPYSEQRVEVVLLNR